MRAFVDRKSYTDIKFDLRTTQSFTARDYSLPEEVAEAVYTHQQNSVLIQEYLEKCYNLSAKERGDGTEVTVPTCIKGKKRAKAKQ